MDPIKWQIASQAGFVLLKLDQGLSSLEGGKNGLQFRQMIITEQSGMQSDKTAN